MFTLTTYAHMMSDTPLQTLQFVSEQDARAYLDTDSTFAIAYLEGPNNTELEFVGV